MGPHNRKTRAWLMAAALCLSSMTAAAFTTGCGEDTMSDDDGGDTSEPLPTGDPIELTTDNAAIGVGFGDAPLMEGHSSLSFIDQAFETAVLEIQIIDEMKALELNPDDVRQNPAPVQAEKRTEELLDEIDDAVEADPEVEDFANYVLVIDVMRVNGTWLVRWDGVNITDRDEPGEYGYFRDDMQEESLEIILDAVGEAAGRKNLTHVVVGAGIDRLQLLNPTDYANFISFYGDVYDGIKDAHPDVAVSPGLNWDNFITEVAALYTPGGVVSEVDFSHIRTAWEEIATPLFEKADFFGLESEPNPELYQGSPENLPESHYALLTEVQEDRPVVWYSVSWPVTSTAEKLSQRDFLRRFLELNAGVDIDLIAWKRTRDLGPDGCPRVTSLGGPRTDCYGGIFSDSLAPNRLSDEFEASLIE